MNVLDCRCNGDTDKFGRGGDCTDGEKGRWCFVNKDACDWRGKYVGKFISQTPCKDQRNPKKPCACNGKSDVTGFGGSCENGTFCYVDKDANCDDIIKHNGMTGSTKSACKGIRERLKKEIGGKFH